MKFKFKSQWLESTNFMIIVSAVTAMLAAYVSLPSTGLISTFPIALILSAAAMLIIKDLYYIPVSFFVMTYLFAFFDDTPEGFKDVLGGYALRVAIKTTLMSLLGCFAVIAFQDKSKIIGKKWLSVTAASLLAVLGFAICFFECGTPWGYLEAKNNIYSTIEQRFDTNGVSLSKVYGIPNGKGYSCDVSFENTDQAGTANYRNGVLVENITELYTDKITADSVLKMTDVLRQEFSDDSFEVKCRYVGTYKTKLSLDRPETVRNHLEYSINIYNELYNYNENAENSNTSRSFKNEASRYFNAVSESGVLCNNLVVNGGVRRKMFYTAKGNPYIPGAFSIEIYNGELMPTWIE